MITALVKLEKVQSLQEIAYAVISKDIGESTDSMVIF